MQIEQPNVPNDQYSISQTHNLVVQNIVSNQQVKFLIFHPKLSHMKMLYRQKKQYKFISGLVAGGRNFIILYAIFQDNLIMQLGRHHIYQDITQLHMWDRLIIIQTRQKVIGLIYQQSMFKNAFMLSLEFLPINQQDQCLCVFDKIGMVFAIAVKNYLLIGFSSALIAKEKTKPIYKLNTEIVNQEVKWNRNDRNYIQELIKIKINDFQLSKIQNLNICHQSLYFVGLKNLQKPNQNGQFNQKAFYNIHPHQFFVDNQAPVCQYLAKKDKQVRFMIPYVYNKQIQCLFCKQNEILIQIQRQMVIIDKQLESNYQIINFNTNQAFSLWIKSSHTVLKVYLRKGNNFIMKQISFNFHFQKFLLKQHHQQSTIIYSNQMEIGCIKLDNQFIKRLAQNGLNSIDQEIIINGKEATIVHRSFANIVDFQIGKNAIYIVESKKLHDTNSSCGYEIKSKIYQLRRHLITDPRPYITHSKKNFLQQQISKNHLKLIRSIRFKLTPTGSNSSDNIIIQQTSNPKNRYIFYKQLISQNLKDIITKENLSFEKVFDNIIFYKKICFQNKDMLVLINSQSQICVFYQAQYQIQDKRPLFILPDFNIKHQKQLHFIQKHLIYPIQHQQKQIYRFFDIKTHVYFDIVIPTKQMRISNIVFCLKSQSFKKKQQLKQIIQILVISQQNLQVFQLQVQSNQLKPSYRCQGIPTGPSMLWSTASQKNNLRSITCPQYILSQYHINTKFPIIKDSFLYRYESNVLLGLVNSQKELIVYRKFINFQTQHGYVWKRIVLPLNIVKAFRPNFQLQHIEYIEQSVLKIYNVILCKGEFLQHNVLHLSYFQMDNCLWTIQKQKIKMVDLRPMGGSNELLFKSFIRKDSKDFSSKQAISPNNNLQDCLSIMSNFIITPIRTMMHKQLMGLEISGDYLVIYSKSGFQIVNLKDFKPVWICNFTTDSPERKEVIINVKAYEHYLAVSYYDYILDETTQFKSIKFKFRIYNILSKTKMLQKQKATQQPILHIRAIGIDKILLTTSSTLYMFLIKGQKSLQPYRVRNFSKRFGLSSFSYIPQFLDQKSRLSKPCYMLFGNSYGGLSFYVGKWLENDLLRQQWFQNVRIRIRNLQLFHYGQELKALVVDQQGNLIVLNLKPDRADKIADFNVGAKANVLRTRHQQDSKVYAAFDDGTIKLISAVKLENPEISFLDFQQESYCKQIPFMGGFNTRTSRLLSQKYRSYKHVSQGNMVDCDLLQDFFSMTTVLKEEISQKSQLKISQLKSIIRSI